MTEKRFTIFGEWHKDCVIDEIRDNTGEYVTIGRVVDLLNENEQLKKDCSNLIDDNTEYVAEINQMHKENEQLKVDKQALIDFIKKEFPKSHKHILEGFND